jgi:hypothetical protein
MRNAENIRQRLNQLSGVEQAKTTAKKKNVCLLRNTAWIKKFQQSAPALLEAVAPVSATPIPL